jgi:hypothetical protein
MKIGADFVSQKLKVAVSSNLNVTYELQTVMVHVNIILCRVYFLSISPLHVSTFIPVFRERFNDMKNGSIKNFGWTDTF